ncbi:hypothetical protein [Streptomyces sp. NPDC001978]|uniref:hypothetical protein n=1 Tax=Streptomyces sp. NPDC001978 TaxID=3364627 RepID=UPI0036CE6F3A
MASAFVLGVQQELRELVEGAAGAGHVAGDGRGDPVPVLGRALAIRTQDQALAVGGEPAIAAGEIAERDQIGCSRRQSGEAQTAAVGGELALGEWLVGAV